MLTPEQMQNFLWHCHFFSKSSLREPVFIAAPYPSLNLASAIRTPFSVVRVHTVVEEFSILCFFRGYIERSLKSGDIFERRVEVACFSCMIRNQKISTNACSPIAAMGNFSNFVFFLKALSQSDENVNRKCQLHYNATEFTSYNTGIACVGETGNGRATIVLH